MAKRRQKQKKYSAEFKLSVIIDMRDNRLGYGKTARKYWDVKTGQEPNYINNLKWR